MGMLEDFLKLINSYPTWAKFLLLLCLAIVGALLVLARPTSPLPLPPRPISNQPLYLRISSIALYPSDPTAEIRLVSSVNDTEYIFPSEGGAKWMKVGPDMNRKIIPIPAAAKYQIVIRMEYRDGRKASGEPVEIIDSSQNATPATLTTPYSAQFKLYPIKVDTSSSAVVGVVSYELNNVGHW